MEKEILEMLKQMNQKIDSLSTEMNEKFNNLETKIDDNTKDIKDIKHKLDITYDQVARTAEDVVGIKKDLAFVEEATANNWANIAKLKVAK